MKQLLSTTFILFTFISVISWAPTKDPSAKIIGKWEFVALEYDLEEVKLRMDSENQQNLETMEEIESALDGVKTNIGKLFFDFKEDGTVVMDYFDYTETSTYEITKKGKNFYLEMETGEKTPSLIKKINKKSLILTSTTEFDSILDKEGKIIEVEMSVVLERR